MRRIRNFVISSSSEDAQDREQGIAFMPKFDANGLMTGVAVDAGSGDVLMIAFLDADSYEQTVRNAVSLGGDSDTLACIAGGIAEACYGGVPEAIRAEVRARLAPDLWRVVEAFEHRYPVGAVRC